MPTLLQIDTCLNTGSTGRITESIGAIALSKGWDCFIVHGARYSNPPSCMKSIKAITKVGEYIHFIEGLFKDNHGLALGGMTRKIVDQIKIIKPDIVHLHCIHGYYINYEILFDYLNTTNIPLVWTFHDCWPFTGHCSHFSMINCEKWKKNGCFDCPLKGDYPKSFVDCSERNYNLKRNLFGSNKNLNIVTVSKWLEDLTKQSFLGKKPIQTIYNGVDTSIFSPKNIDHLRYKHKIGNRKVLLGVATAWQISKGFNDFMRLSNCLPDDVCIIMIGLDERQIKYLPSNVIGLKRTESVSELAEYYSLADIVLNLSYQETFGLTTVEGMSCGTPSIVYNTTASPELITEKTGRVVNPGDIIGLKNAIDELLYLGKDSFSAECRRRVCCNYDKEKQFKKYMELYKSLL